MEVVTALLPSIWVAPAFFVPAYVNKIYSTAYLEHFDGDGDFTSRRRRPVAFPDDSERAVAQLAVKAEIFLVDETRQRLRLGVVRAEVRR